MIELDAVRVERGGRVLLDGVSLRVETGVVALVGPSGAGKTTLLRVVLGLEAPSAGHVRLDGRVASGPGRIELLPEERNVAMVFQDLALWPHLSVEGNLAYGLAARGIARAERARRIAEALGWVGLGGRERARPHELSAGERQRVAIARALVVAPAALLLDEPLASLDVALEDELLELFARVFAERALPVVHVTHDPREARRLASRVVVLEAGRVVQDATPAELESAPATPFVEAFVRAW